MKISEVGYPSSCAELKLTLRLVSFTKHVLKIYVLNIILKPKTKSLKQYVVYVYPAMFDITKLLTSEIVHSALLSITENLTEFQVLNTA